MTDFKNNQTGRSSNIFTVARIKLTLFYTIFIAVIVIFFSISIYYSYLYYLRGSFEDELFGSENDDEISISLDENNENSLKYFVTPDEIRNSASRNLRNIILVVDGAIIIVSTFMGYLLAGITLRPIQRNHEIQRRFMSDTSHELRTPLAIMKTGLEVQIRDLGCPLECKPVLSSNLEEVNRMTEIVENLLFISRMDSDNELFRSEKININALIIYTVQSIRDYAMEKKIDIILNNPEFSEEKIEAVFVKGDLDKLKQAFFNILKNAVDYSDVGGKIEIKTVKQLRFVQIEIKDYGHGIPKEDKPHIFERFYRAANAASLSKEGSGLGLAITKEIIIKHKGEIKIESSYKNWTKVTVILPF